MRMARGLSIVLTLALLAGESRAQEAEFKRAQGAARALTEKGRWREAEPEAMAAVRAATSLGGADARIGAAALELGEVYARLQRWDEARRSYTQARAFWATAIEPEDPRYAEVELAEGALDLLQGRAEAAEGHALEALKRLGAAHGKSPAVAPALLLAARCGEALKKPREADRFAERAAELTVEAEPRLKLEAQELLLELAFGRADWERAGAALAALREAAKGDKVGQSRAAMWGARLRVTRGLRVDAEEVQGAVAALTGALGEAHPLLAEALAWRAWAACEAGQLGAAKAPLERAVSILEGALGGEHAALGLPLAVRAERARMLGDWGVATADGRRALRLLASAPQRGGMRAWALLTVGQRELDQGRLAAAREALAAARAAGEGRAVEALATLALARLARWLGEVEASDEARAAARARLIALAGEGAPWLAAVELEAAAAELARGKESGAERRAESAWELAKASWGEAHLWSQRARALRGRARLARRVARTAEDDVRGALEELKTGLGPEHWEVGMSTLDLARLSQLQRQEGPAELYYKAGLRILTKVLGPGHPESLEGLREYGLWMVEQREAERGVRVLDKAIAAGREAQGDDAPVLAPLYEALGEACRAAGRRDEAKAAKARAKAIRDGAASRR